MLAVLLKIVGIIHGVFGLYMFAFLVTAHATGLFRERHLESWSVANRTILGTLVGALLLVCAYASWIVPAYAWIFATASIVTYILLTAVETVARSGSLLGMGTLARAFYVGLLAQVVGAVALFVLAHKAGFA